MIKDLINILTLIMELGGVVVIAIGAFFAIVVFIKSSLIKDPLAYESLRGSLGKSILLGLEFLVAADIINTVAIDPTISSVAVLGLIVLIRTFLSFSLNVEIDGRLPWNKSTDN
ncbi:MAG: DUF1622 domain-containing protein [Bacteriovoracaceae bacterium]|nr:DUF1622 domain-containing protein [Bacteriovoracaceae bacterium]